MYLFVGLLHCFLHSNSALYEIFYLFSMNLRMSPWGNLSTFLLNSITLHIHFYSFNATSLHIYLFSSCKHLDLGWFIFFHLSFYFFVPFYHSTPLLSFIMTPLISASSTFFIKHHCVHNEDLILFSMPFIFEIDSFPVFYYKSLKNSLIPMQWEAGSFKELVKQLV